MRKYRMQLFNACSSFAQRICVNKVFHPCSENDKRSCLKKFMQNIEFLFRRLSLTYDCAH